MMCNLPLLREPLRNGARQARMEDFDSVLRMLRRCCRGEGRKFRDSAEDYTSGVGSLVRHGVGHSATGLENVLAARHLWMEKIAGPAL
ncbi:hypothetical protein AKG11_03955 [Shinella sp. SUS2]|jgi:hypothetical protein|nr:hypothetical protein SHLA_15c000070 [Shinella sp. DD12]KNY18289.1 hypothetical protein AKG11_03955 [Shinella sp. SUS2]KOC77484.1 hypothetical protein AKG10_01425 [Shinella sp. GWS1]